MVKKKTEIKAYVDCVFCVSQLVYLNISFRYSHILAKWFNTVLSFKLKMFTNYLEIKEIRLFE